MQVHVPSAGPQVQLPFSPARSLLSMWTQDDAFLQNSVAAFCSGKRRLAMGHA